MTDYFDRMITGVWIVVLLAASTSSQATGELRTREGERLWYSLQGDDNSLFANATTRGPLTSAHSPLVKPPAEERRASLPFRETWLLETIKRRFSKISGVNVVEYSTTRHSSGGQTNEVRRGLEVFGPGETLDEVKAWLDDLRRLRSAQIKIDLHIVRGSSGEKPRATGAEVEALSITEFEAQLKQAEDHVETEIIARPTLLALNGQRVCVGIGNQTKYVKDCSFPVVDGEPIADPVIAVIQDGVVAEMTAVIHPDEAQVTVEANVWISVLRRPIREITVTPEGTWNPSDKGDKKPVPMVKQVIQLPEVVCTSWNSHGLEVSPDTWFVVKGLSGPRKNAFDEIAPLTIYAHLRVLRPSGRQTATTGQVVGIDRQARLVFVRWPDVGGEAPSAAGRLNLWRAGKHIAQIDVVEHAGCVSICKMPDPRVEVRMGDLVR
ncbi:MAG: hypothetical protein JXA87_04235 [Thermoleophilia bacterium]|nr:hypothetical protein [Thermoleophilia bacterium]